VATQEDEERGPRDLGGDRLFGGGEVNGRMQRWGRIGEASLPTFSRHRLFPSIDHPPARLLDRLSSGPVGAPKMIGEGPQVSGGSGAAHGDAMASCQHARFEP
jgi:hypothetical protein